jgi:hypothetical protein
MKRALLLIAAFFVFGPRAGAAEVVPAPPPPPPPGRLPPGQRLELVARFDADGDGRLDATERKAARAALPALRAQRQRGPRGFGFQGRPGGGGPPPAGFEQAPALPGPRVSPAEVRGYGSEDLYDPTIVRTLFLDFAGADWEQELADFHHTDVELPATLTVDGRRYPEVGVHFRGMSSFMMVRPGHKRSLGLSLDLADSRQSLGGYQTLNLLNAHEDPTFVRTILYYQIAGRHIPTPRANFVRLVINGESWGIHVNAQQFNKTLLQQLFGSGKGARWKVPGSPGGDGGLAYLGPELGPYRQRYQIKSGDHPEDWAALVQLCRVLTETPLPRLEAALRPLLDVDGTLAFLALENTLINGDGYWARASDYSLYRDPRGRFHLLPHDANETFAPPHLVGPRGPRRRPPAGATDLAGSSPVPPAPPAPAGVGLDPLAGSDDPRRPLLSRMLAVPALRARYLGYVHTIARDVLDWDRLRPVLVAQQALIADEVARDTRKLYTTAAFTGAVHDDSPPGSRNLSLKAFVTQRRAYLLAHPLVQQTRPRPLPSPRS